MCSRGGEGQVGLEDFLVELGGCCRVGASVEVIFGGQGGEDGVPVLGWVLALAGDVGETAADGVSAAAEGALGAGGQVVGVDGGGIVGGASVARKARKGVDRVVVVVVVRLPMGGTGSMALFVKSVMHVSPGMKDHFDNGNHEDRRQCNCARHCGVLFRPKAVETLVAERDESGRQKMDESRGDQDSGTEVTDGEEEHGRESNRGEAGHEDGKGAGEKRDAEDDGESSAVKGRVVKRLIGDAALGTS